MGRSGEKASDQRRRRSDQVRLESWKAIATYLNRSVRTVRRWEANENLPIHRHQHNKGSSVYAYSSELDAWRSRNDGSLTTPPAPKEPASAEAPATRPHTPPLLRYAAIALVAAGVGSFAGYQIHQPIPAADRTVNDDPTWVLVSAPVNHGRVTELGENLRAALRREISRGGVGRTLTQEDIRQQLSLMRQDPMSTPDPAIAREIAVRDGRVEAVLVPRVEQLGESFVLSVEMTDPGTGELVAFPSETVDDLGSALPAFERLARAVNGRLARHEGSGSGKELPEVTTSSTLALRLYAQAMDLLNDDKPMPACELLGLAIEEDPQFASALALQSWAMRRAGESLETYLPVARRATEHAGAVSAPENYFIDGTFSHFSGDLVRADADYRALLAVQPDHLFGADAMLELCLGSRSSAECTTDKVRVARLRPHHLESNIDAAWSLAADGGDAELAAYFAGRAVELMRHGAANARPDSVAHTLMFPALAAWNVGDVQTALRETQALRLELETLPAGSRSVLARRLSMFALMLGRTDEARQLLDFIPDMEDRNETLSGILFASGQMEQLRDHLARTDTRASQSTAMLMAMAGLNGEAMALQGTTGSDRSALARDAVIRARVALDEQRLDAAAADLESAIASLTPDDGGFFFVGPDLLSMIRSKQGDLPAAVTVLESTAPWRSAAAYRDSGLFWMMCQRQLARLYREIGRESEAAQIEDRLRGLLELADDDFPLLRSLADA